MSSHTMNGDPMDDWRFGFEVKSAQIGAAEVGTGVTYTMDRVEFRKIGDRGKEKMRPVIKLKESDLDWVTCKTTLLCVEAMFGRSPRNWVGKQITLFWDPKVKFGKETVGGVRVAGAPGIKDMTVTVKLPKKADQKIPLKNTAPEPSRSIEDERAEFLEHMQEAHGITEAMIDVFLKPHGQTVKDQKPAGLRTLANRVEQIKAAQPDASEGDDGSGEWVDAE